MNLKEIKEMINLMNENGLVELEIEREGMRIKIKKSYHETSGEKLLPLDYKIETTLKPVASSQKEPSVSETIKVMEIKSPMVGTFYRAPSPEASPFVEVGQVIEAGQVICIIEAMKLMNEIKSEIKGKVVDVLVDNAEPVEFGQTLFLIEPV